MHRLVSGLATAFVVMWLTSCSGEVSASMPDVVGKRLDVALSDIEGAGIDADVEVSGGGMFGVLDKSNWTVCSQEPAHGVAATAAPRVTVARTCEAAKSPTSTAVATNPHESPSQAPDPGAESVPKYGQTVPFTATRSCCPGEPVSLDVTVSPPTPFTPEEPSDATQAANVYFTVTIKNRGTAEFEPGLDYAISGLGGEDPSLDDVAGEGIEGDQIFADAQLGDGAMGFAIPPGNSLTYRAGFSVASADDVVFKMRPYGLGGSALYWAH